MRLGASAESGSGSCAGHPLPFSAPRLLGYSYDPARTARRGRGSTRSSERGHRRRHETESTSTPCERNARRITWRAVPRSWVAVAGAHQLGRAGAASRPGRARSAAARRGAGGVPAEIELDHLDQEHPVERVRPLPVETAITTWSDGAARRNRTASLVLRLRQEGGVLGTIDVGVSKKWTCQPA
jgi:hypothetical protein